MNLNEIAARTVDKLLPPLSETIQRINTVWGKEHQANGAHMIPQWRSVAIGSEMGSSNFVGVTAAWTVDTADIVTFDWWKHGNAMAVSVDLESTTVTAGATVLTFPIPGAFTAALTMLNPIYLTDNGTSVNGIMYVLANQSVVTVARSDSAAFTGGTTRVLGQLTFRTTN